VVTDGFKVFQDGNVLTASEVMGFMMRQQLCVFASAAARDASIDSPEEGQFAFLKDDDVLTYFDGLDWQEF
jgi:hypothetical protein